jgi:hypothetical protein
MNGERCQMSVEQTRCRGLISGITTTDPVPAFGIDPDLSRRKPTEREQPGSDLSRVIKARKRVVLHWSIRDGVALTAVECSAISAAIEPQNSRHLSEAVRAAVYSSRSWKSISGFDARWTGLISLNGPQW